MNIFGECFGILYYPFELLVDFLNRVSQINDTDTAIISVPEFKLSFMGYEAVFFSGMSYDLNDILENETFNSIHSVYLIFVDILLWLGVVYLAAKVLHSVIGGSGLAVSDTISNSDNALDEQAYENYARGQRAQERYNNEQGSSDSYKRNKIGFGG